VIFGLAPCLAQPAPAAANPQVPTVTDFLATLSAGGPSGPGAAEVVPPAPVFLQTSTGCTSDSQCPPDKLCCLACAFPGCTHKACLTPMDGHCPLIP
jgi:hypothetical protein